MSFSLERRRMETAERSGGRRVAGSASRAWRNWRSLGPLTLFWRRKGRGLRRGGERLGEMGVWPAGPEWMGLEGLGQSRVPSESRRPGRREGDSAVRVPRDPSGMGGRGGQAQVGRQPVVVADASPNLALAASSPLP